MIIELLVEERRAKRIIIEAEEEAKKIIEEAQERAEKILNKVTLKDRMDRMIEVEKKAAKKEADVLIAQYDKRAKEIPPSWLSQWIANWVFLCCYFVVLNCLGIAKIR